MSRLTLTPKQTDEGVVYIVAGDMALFVSESAMQDNRGESIALHCSFPLMVEVMASRPWKRQMTLAEATTVRSFETHVLRAQGVDSDSPNSIDSKTTGSDQETSGLILENNGLSIPVSGMRILTDAVLAAGAPEAIGSSAI